jgi:hypothetical protein
MSFTFVFKNDGWWDTQVVARLIDENESHRLKDLYSKYIAHEKEQAFAEYFKNFKNKENPLSRVYLERLEDAVRE